MPETKRKTSAQSAGLSIWLLHLRGALYIPSWICALYYKFLKMPGITSLYRRWWWCFTAVFKRDFTTFFFISLFSPCNLKSPPKTPLIYCIKKHSTLILGVLIACFTPKVQTPFKLKTQTVQVYATNRCPHCCPRSLSTSFILFIYIARRVQGSVVLCLISGFHCTQSITGGSSYYYKHPTLKTLVI